MTTRRTAAATIAINRIACNSLADERFTDTTSRQQLLDAADRGLWRVDRASPGFRRRF
jgi:hypothetical protein